jgi:hypothetical protein
MSFDLKLDKLLILKRSKELGKVKYSDFKQLFNFFLKSNNIPKKLVKITGNLIESKYKSDPELNGVIKFLRKSLLNEYKSILRLINYNNLFGNQIFVEKLNFVSKILELIVYIFKKNIQKYIFDQRKNIVKMTIIILNNLYANFNIEDIETNEYEIIDQEIDIPYLLYYHSESKYLDMFYFFKRNCTTDINIPDFKILNLNVLYNTTIKEELGYNSFLEESFKEIITEDYYKNNLFKKEFQNINFRFSGISEIFHRLSPDIINLQEIDIHNVSSYQIFNKFLNSYVNKYKGKFFYDYNNNTEIRGLAIFWNFIVFEYIYSTSFKISEYGNKKPRTVGVVILKHRYTNQYIISATCKMTQFKENNMIPNFPNLYTNYAKGIVEFFKSNSEFSIYIKTTFGLNINEVPIILSSDLNNFFHNPIISTLFNDNFESINYKDNMITGNQITTSKGGSILDYMFFKSINNSISLGCRLLTDEGLLNNIKIDYFDDYIDKSLNKYLNEYRNLKSTEEELTDNLNQKINDIKLIIKTISKRGFFFPNKNYFSDHLIIGAKFNINIICDSDHDCLNKKLSKCKSIVNKDGIGTNNICIKKIFEINFANYSNYKGYLNTEIEKLFNENNEDILNKNLLESYIFILIHLDKHSDKKVINIINSLNKKKLKGIINHNIIFQKFKELKFKEGVEILNNNLFIKLSSFELFEYFTQLFLNIFSKVDLDTNNRIIKYFNLFDLFKIPINSILFIVTLLYKLNFTENPKVVLNIINIIPIITSDKYHFYNSVTVNNLPIIFEPDDKNKKNLLDIILSIENIIK